MLCCGGGGEGGGDEGGVEGVAGDEASGGRGAAFAEQGEAVGGRVGGGERTKRIGGRGGTGFSNDWEKFSAVFQ